MALSDPRHRPSPAPRGAAPRGAVRRAALVVVAGLGVLAAPLPAVVAEEAPAAAPAPAEARFSTEQLEQIAAPVALYPDSLLAQIFMAATYPIEVVQADRWCRANPGVSGTALDEAMKAQSWDLSVKSLCALPAVLKQMSENLDWSQDLGDAFLEQRADLMAAVQRLRKAAMDAGHLETTTSQTVVVEREVVVIRVVNPDVIVLPVYSPTVIIVRTYPYYYYPVLYTPPPPAARVVTFAAGVAVGAAIWGGCNWHGNDIDIDVERHAHFEKNTNINVNASRTNVGVVKNGRASWSHDPAHRRGVNYRSPATARSYGATGRSARVSQSDARGRGTTPPRPSNEPTRPKAEPGRPAPEPTREAPRPSTQEGGGAFSGSRDSDLDRAASDRGGRSRDSGGARGGRRTGPERRN